MPTAFSQTTRALAGETTAGAPVAWAIGLLLLAAWLGWFLLGEVTVHATSAHARLEVVQLPHHLPAPAAGRVAAIHVAIGDEVAAGQPLLDLDTADQRLQLAETAARLAALPRRIASAGQELAALQQARAADQRAIQAALDAARARIREAEAAARFAAAQALRMKAQSAAGGIADIDALRAKAEADRLAAARDGLAAELRRLELEGLARQQDAEARAEALRCAALALE
ncbi:biotin/lipoyl-binding protein, partial [Paracraurococcus ruber]|uniref:biotin/lipoyl-binding protein n=1 Tax=Paracraurococcus ruber TaxID=77675 RepID=UPI001057B193